ncbi:Tkl protein kinase [Globisporangium polare]
MPCFSKPSVEHLLLVRTIATGSVEQGSLWVVLRSRRRQIVNAIRAKFTLDTAMSMNYLHQLRRSILHRDMKSPSLLVQKDFSVKISDFGLSRVKAQIQTMAGNCGTVQWVAPEVLGNQKYAEKADVLSFGIVMREICTGKCPNEGMVPIQMFIMLAFGSVIWFKLLEWLH